MHTDDTEVTEAAPAAEEASVPATEIIKAVKKAGKRKPKAKVSKRGPVKKATKPVKAKKTKPVSAKRGPKGNPPEKVARHGNAAYGAKVRKARMAKEWNQRDLAKRVKLGGPTNGGQSTISNIENGTAGASAELQERLRKVLGVKPCGVPKRAPRGSRR